MIQSLEGKRLLILGGVKMACDLVQRAQKLGAYVSVADYNTDSPAKAVADQGVLLDATDVEAIVDFCRKEKIDGVTTGYVDILMPVCYEVCKRLGLPYYATEKMIAVSTDKIAFKKMCHQYGVPVPETYHVTKENYFMMADEMAYPVFVKPLDASGSRGASVCRNKDEFIPQFEEALSYSKKKEVVVEEYLEGTDFILDYLLVEGKAYLLSMFDRKVCDDRPSAINHANLLIAPSHKIDKYITDVQPLVTKMFEGMGFTDGLIFLQGYIDGDRITFFEMGCRLGGTFPNVDEYYTGINPMDLLIHHALTGKMMNPEACDTLQAKFAGKGGVINLLAAGDGRRIAKITGLDEIEKMPEVVRCIRYMKEGEAFDGGRFTDRPVAIIYIVAKDLSDFKRVVNLVYQQVQVSDANGESLLLPEYAVEGLDDRLYS